MRKKVLPLFIFVLFLGPRTRAGTIDVDLGIHYQTIDNFGASDCWSMQKIGAWSTPAKERVADLLFSTEKGIGLSAWRFNIGAGINRSTISHSWRTVETFEVAEGVYDWTRQAEERWFLEAAKERGVDQFIAFVNSPPSRMTRNGYTNCTDGEGSTNLKDGYEGQFARYLVDILRHFRDEWDISFDYISPVNEPQWEWNTGSDQEGNRASNQDIRAIVDALYDELQRQDLETRISLVESGDLKSWYRHNAAMRTEYREKYGEYLPELFDDENIREKIGKHLSGHSYWSDRISTQLVQDRQALFDEISPFLEKGWKYWVSEYAVLDGPYGEGGHGRDLSIKTALDVARVIHYDLTILQASAWQWWTAVSPEDYKDGLLYTDYKTNANMQNAISSKLLWALGNYSRFIRPGSVRILLSGTDDKYGLMGSAYLNPGRDKLIIVFVNMSESAKPVELNIIGLDSDKSVTALIPCVTSDKDGDDLKQYDAISVGNNYDIPRRSVVTLVGGIVDKSDLEILGGESPGGFELFQNFPNPFNHHTRLCYYLPQQAKVQLSIYSLLGKKIKTVVDGTGSTGVHCVSWDGTNEIDESVGSGLYLYVLQSGNHKKMKKMLFIR